MGVLASFIHLIENRILAVSIHEGEVDTAVPDVDLKLNDLIRIDS